MARYLVTGQGHWSDLHQRYYPAGEVIELADDVPPSRTWVGLDPASKANVDKVNAEADRRAGLTDEEREKENVKIRAATRRKNEQAALEGMKRQAEAEYNAKIAKQQEEEQRRKDAAFIESQKGPEGQTLTQMERGNPGDNQTGEPAPAAPAPAQSIEQASHIPVGPGVVRKPRASDTKV